MHIHPIPQTVIAALDGQVQAVSQSGEALLGGLQFQLGALLHRNIGANFHEAHQFAIGVVHRVHVSVQPVLVAIFGAVDHLDAAGYARIGRRRQTRNSFRIRLAAAQKIPRGSTPRFFQRVAAHTGKAGIDPSDVQLGVGDDDCVVGGLHYTRHGVELGRHAFGQVLGTHPARRQQPHRQRQKKAQACTADCGQGDSVVIQRAIERRCGAHTQLKRPTAHQQNPGGLRQGGVFGRIESAAVQRGKLAVAAKQQVAGLFYITIEKLNLHCFLGDVCHRGQHVRDRDRGENDARKCRHTLVGVSGVSAPAVNGQGVNQPIGHGTLTCQHNAPRQRCLTRRNSAL